MSQFGRTRSRSGTIGRSGCMSRGPRLCLSPCRYGCLGDIFSRCSTPQCTVEHIKNEFELDVGKVELGQTLISRVHTCFGGSVTRPLVKSPIEPQKFNGRRYSSSRRHSKTHLAPRIPCNGTLHSCPHYHAAILTSDDRRLGDGE